MAVVPTQKQDSRVTKESPLVDKIHALYDEGRAPVDIARLLSIDVETVLIETGNGSLVSVQSMGDTIDSDEAGPEAKLNREGRTFKVSYTKN